MQQYLIEITPEQVDSEENPVFHLRNKAAILERQWQAAGLKVGEYELKELLIAAISMQFKNARHHHFAELLRQYEPESAEAA